MGNIATRSKTRKVNTTQTEMGNGDTTPTYDDDYEKLPAVLTANATGTEMENGNAAQGS